MSRTSGDRVGALFAGALEQPREQWTAYVAAAVEDPEVSREVLALLLAHEGKGRFDRIADRLQGVQPAAASILIADLLDQLRDALAGRYTIERELGRGGMALVFLAQDLKHNRAVAIKVLRPELAVALGAGRFLREIHFVARLHHPHILPLFDSGEAAGFLYYVMPYVEGESLRDRLERETQLPVDESLRIAREVAAALAHAHNHGVVHRDIKPENILLSGGEAVVADFGIARAVSAAGGESIITETGIALGTPAYMSPEQATARGTVDGRSDIYALGCVLYEMLGGEPPFGGPSAQAILARHALDPVPNLRTLRATVPEGLVQAIERALNKSPADRFQTAGTFAAALTEPNAPPVGPRAVVAPVTRPSRRLWTLIGLGTVATAAAVIVPLGLWRSPVYVPGRVVVAPLENETGDPALADFAGQLVSTLPDVIAREGVGDPVPAATARDLLTRARGSPGKVAEWLARETGAGVLLRGACTRGTAGTTCQVDLLRMPAKELRMSVSVTGNPAQRTFGVELTERLLVALFLQRTWGDRVTWLGEYVPRSLAAVRAFKQAWDRGEWQFLGEAARLDTGWVEAAAWTALDSSDAAAESLLARLARRPGLLEGERETVAFVAANRRRDAEQAFQLARRRFAVNPEWWVGQVTYWARVTGRAATTVAVSSYADSAIGSGPRRIRNSLTMRGYALHQLGRYQDQLQLAHEFQRRFPAEELDYRTDEAMALAALGEVDSLRRRLAEWEAKPEPGGPYWAGSRAYVAGLELMAHGKQREGQEILVGTLPSYRRHGESEGYRIEVIEVLLEAGEPREAQVLALAALRTMKSLNDSLDVLPALGMIAARQGRFDDAARYDRLLARAGQRPGLAGKAAVARAIIAGWLGDREGAVRFLEEARTYGLAEHFWVHRDLAFAGMRDYPPFQRFLRPRE